MDNRFRGKITSWTQWGNVHTSISKKYTDQDAIMIALPKKKIYFRKGWNFPNPLLAVRPVHWLGIICICYMICIFELEISTWG